jgi:collagenase-like PrtC family protease
MPGLEFSVPYNNNPETLAEIFKLQNLNGNRIREIYLSGPQQYSGSGRIMAEMSEENFVKVLKLIHGQGIRANLVMNTTCEGLDWYRPEVVKPRMDFLKRMYREHGLEAVTLANPLYVEFARKAVPDMEVGASVLCDIDSIQRATLYEALGADVLTPDVDSNRDLRLLRKMRTAVKAELKLMVNDGCLYKCPFRRSHFNWISHKSKENSQKIEESFFLHCAQVTRGDLTQVFKSNWIRPEDLDRYTGISRYFKIVGRERVPSWVLRVTEAYMRQSWSGDLFEILSGSLHNFSKRSGASVDNDSLTANNFFDTVTSCGYDCSECGYCTELARELIVPGELTPGKKADLEQEKHFFPEAR